MFSCTSKVNRKNHMYNKEQELKETMESDGQKNRKNSLLSTISTKINDANEDEDKDKDDDHDVPLPGFRFHPTDEELVGFYLRRKVEKRPISIQLIKQIDIYKYDPWDLPKASNNVGDKEWYFFCKRGRKYRNSIRPNRVTGSGFWKATGIDRPIYSGGGEGRDCIGLKKSLVYYRGCAGKGTKTDWMMHEFRLPSDHNEKPIDVKVVKPITQETAEVWTLCRILKRNVSYRKCMPLEWKDFSGGKRMIKQMDSISKTCNTTFDSTECRENYISFNNNNNNTASASPPVMNNIQRSRNDMMIMKPFTSNITDQVMDNNNITTSTRINEFFCSSSISQETPSLTSYNSIQSSADPSDFFLNYADWDELRSMVDMHYNVMGFDVIN